MKTAHSSENELPMLPRFLFSIFTFYHKNVTVFRYLYRKQDTNLWKQRENRKQQGDIFVTKSKNRKLKQKIFSQTKQTLNFFELEREYRGVKFPLINHNKHPEMSEIKSAWWRNFHSSSKLYNIPTIHFFVSWLREPNQ